MKRVIDEETWMGLGEWLGVRSVTSNSVWKTVGEDYDGVERMKVPGGHLYRSRVSSGGPDFSVTSVALAFVPDASETTSKKKAVRDEFGRAPHSKQRRLLS